MGESSVYRCPSCGAPAEPRAQACEWCRSPLHATRCPWCFAWVDERASGCPRCGARAQADEAFGAGRPCPSCRKPETLLSVRSLDGAHLAACGACGGLWADAASFKRLCEDRAAQTAYLGVVGALAAPPRADPSANDIVYRPCPICAELMNRFNFSGSSGVILDACKPHGVWFDSDELERIVAFIRGGGLDAAREHEKLELELERRRLEAAAGGAGPDEGSGFRSGHVASARALLGVLFGD